jgi:formylglycine-generating enzyme required for sulfatase activity
MLVEMYLKTHTIFGGGYRVVRSGCLWWESGTDWNNAYLRNASSPGDEWNTLGMRLALYIK